MAAEDLDHGGDDGAELGDDLKVVGPTGLRPQDRPRKGKVVFIDSACLPADYAGSMVTVKRLVPKVEKGKVVSQKEVEDRGVKIVLVPLLPSEELEAADRADGSNAKLQYEFIKISMRRINDREVRRENEEQEDLLRDVGPQGRALLLAGYNRLVQADKEAVGKFDYYFRDE